MYDSGEEFLNELYKDLHISDIVMHTADKSDSPTTKINKYLARLDRIVNKAHLKEHDWNLFKSLCHSKYVIKEEDIKEDYIAKKISSTTSRDKVIYNTITASKDSLDTWIDFLGSLEDEEMWVKLWIFKGITSMGNYNDDRKAFSRRTKHTTSPFPMFDPVITLDVIDKVKTLIRTNDQELIDDAITSESFARLYAYYFSMKREEILKRSKTTNGEWIHYEGVSDRIRLRSDIIGKGTLWCIENRKDAKEILENGVIDIYYSYDEEKKPTIPRLAIVSSNKNIKEVRGIGHSQNIEPFMEDILERKLLSYNYNEKVNKTLTNARRLTYLTEKETYSKSDIEFLYEIKEKIGFFGYSKDERIEKLKAKRNMQKDLAYYFDCQEDEVAITEEGIKDNTICYYGDISETKEELNISLPKYVVGDVRCPNLVSTKGLERLEVVTNDLSLPKLDSKLASLKEVWGYDTAGILDKKQDKKM